MLLHDIILVVNVALNVFMTIYMAYFGVMILPFFRPIRKAEPKGKVQHRYAAVIAARNEEEVIGDSVASILAQEYPKELFDVYVIPNNCTDNTAAAAAAAGAKVLDIDIPVKSKGEVLRWTFDYFKAEGNPHYDAFLIFDADNIALPGFISEMNDAYNDGELVAQGFSESKNPYETGMSSAYSIYYWASDCFFNQSRWNMKQSSIINGKGFMITQEALDKLGGWHTRTLTEDMEMTALCALQGIKIGWVREAIILDEQPTTFAASWRQRKRWSAGVIQCSRLYGGEMLKSFFKKPSAAKLDVFILHKFPVIQVLGMVSFLLFSAMLLIEGALGMETPVTLLMRFFTCIDLMLLSSVMMGVVTVVSAQKNFVKNIKGMFFFFIFVLSWLPITFAAMFSGKNMKWEQIKHRKTAGQQIEGK